jgi:hypothetical protein
VTLVDQIRVALVVLVFQIRCRLVPLRLTVAAVVDGDFLLLALVALVAAVRQTPVVLLLVLQTLAAAVEVQTRPHLLAQAALALLSFARSRQRTRQASRLRVARTRHSRVTARTA